MELVHQSTGMKFVIYPYQYATQISISKMLTNFRDNIGVSLSTYFPIFLVSLLSRITIHHLTIIPLSNTLLENDCLSLCTLHHQLQTLTAALQFKSFIRTRNSFLDLVQPELRMRNLILQQ